MNTGEARTCPAGCGYGWIVYEDGYLSCPRCVPGQPKPMMERRRDPSDFIGPEWVWDAAAGPRGMWMPLEDYRLFHRSGDPGYEALWSLIRRSEYEGLDVFEAARTEILRLRGLEHLPPMSSAPSHVHLADRCQRLDEDLRRKRAECDALRDRVAELEARK